jgi:hypothetical protein
MLGVLNMKRMPEQSEYAHVRGYLYPRAQCPGDTLHSGTR